MSAPAKPAVTLPFGTYPDGAPAALPIVNDGTVTNTLIIGSAGTGKTTLLHSLGQTAEQHGIATLHLDTLALADPDGPDLWRDLGALHEQRWHQATGPEHADMPAGLLLIDTTPAVMHVYGWELHTMLTTFRHERIGIVVAVQGITATAFTGATELRDALLHGNVAAMRTKDRSTVGLLPGYTGQHLANLPTGGGFLLSGPRPAEPWTASPV